MVFSKLDSHEKDAFFSLLDELSTSQEYFASRPELLAGLASPDSAAKLASTGLKHGISKAGTMASSNPFRPAGATPQRSSANPSGTSSASSGASFPAHDVDAPTPSVKAMINSLQNAKIPTPSPPSSAQTTFATRKTALQPPSRNATEGERTDGVWATALYDFTPQEEGELALREGQRVFVTDSSDEGWWSGEIDGQKGQFPRTYVELQ